MAQLADVLGRLLLLLNLAHDFFLLFHVVFVHAFPRILHFKFRRFHRLIFHVVLGRSNDLVKFRLRINIWVHRHGRQWMAFFVFFSWFSTDVDVDSIDVDVDDR